jgi:prepilin-type N-terminal cleavage/methylation domain-containing protein
MKRSNKKQKGFTIIELLIVIVVIGILAAIVITTYGGIQAKQRNTTRQDDVKSLQAQLEAFYSQNGYYPSLTDMNSASWRTKNMTSLDTNDLIDPSSSETNANVQLTATPGAKVYAYQVTDSNGNSCETSDTNCAKYTLTATYEGTVNGSHTYVKQSLD